MGLKVENTNCNWVAADNFRLYYCGGDAGPDPEVVPATSLQIANTTLSIEKGKSTQLGEITVLPENTTDRKTLTYTSNNTEVVTVTSTGIVTAKTVGSTTITVALEARPSVSKTITKHKNRFITESLLFVQVTENEIEPVGLPIGCPHHGLTFSRIGVSHEMVDPLHIDRSNAVGQTIKVIVREDP